jgi:hypothetical protein
VALGGGGSRRRLMVAGLWSVGLACVLGLVMVVGDATDVMRHIWPGVSMAPSTSDVPYELQFRNRRADKANNAPKVSEWVLAPPRAFVFDKLGSNGIINDPKGAGETFFEADLAANLSSDDDALIATTKVSKDVRRSRSMVIYITNFPAHPGLVDAGGCVPQERLSEAIGSASKGIPCSERDYMCKIQIPVDGWDVSVSATLDLYKSPEHVCAVVRRFLDEHTTRRDKIES